MRNNAVSGYAHNKKIMSPAGGLGHKQAGGFAIMPHMSAPVIEKLGPIKEDL